jgi:hypothetical protein
VGEVAYLLGVSRRRVQWWIENGCLLVEKRASGKGYYYRIPLDEVEVAQRAVRHQRKYRLTHLSPGLFDTLRQEYGTEPPTVDAGPASCTG